MNATPQHDPLVADPRYNPWGFKLNLMYASIPPKYYRNLHNFHEFNAPRIDIGNMTASLYEQAILGFNPHFLPRVADAFYRERRQEIGELVKHTLADIGYTSAPDDIEFQDGMPFVPPTREVPRGTYSSDKRYALFVVYHHDDTEGDPETAGIPFLRVVLANLTQAPSGGDGCFWEYTEVRIGRGEEAYQYKPVIAAPMFIAYFRERYTDLEFDYCDPADTPIYEAHSRYFKVDDARKRPYELLIRRETVSPPNEYGEFVAAWDGVPANRSVVASQAYYDWDDDLQSAHGDALLVARIKSLEESVYGLGEGTTRPEGDIQN